MDSNGLERFSRNGRQYVHPLIDNRTVEYTWPGDYGTKCKAWDHKLPPLCADSDSPANAIKKDTPDWCSAAWCYVSPKSCTRTDLKRSVIFGEESELWYSYGALFLIQPEKVSF